MAAITSSLLVAGVSGYMAYDASERERKAKNEMNNYERQTLDNAFKDIPISTVGSELMREENQRTAADLIDASRNGGIRGVFAGIPKIQSFTNTSNREARAYLDDQDIKRNYAIAGDNQNLRGIRENRDNANISSLSNQEQKAYSDKWNGISGAVSGLAYTAFAIEDQQKENNGEDRDPISPINQVQPVGYASYQPFNNFKF